MIARVGESLLLHAPPFNTAHFHWATRKGLKREKKSAFAYQPRRHVLEHRSARLTIERKLDHSPLLILLQRDKNFSLRASHGGQLRLPAAASAQDQQLLLGQIKRIYLLFAILVS